MAELEPRVRGVVLRSRSGVISSPETAQILMVYYNKVPIWDLPGGHINKGEKPEIAVLREIKEETGISANLVKQLGMYERYRMLRNGVRLHYKVRVFLCYGDGKIYVHDTAEIKQAAWMSFSEALKHIDDTQLRNICEGVFR